MQSQLWVLECSPLDNCQVINYTSVRAKCGFIIHNFNSSEVSSYHINYNTGTYNGIDASMNSQVLSYMFYTNRNSFMYCVLIFNTNLVIHYDNYIAAAYI